MKALVIATNNLKRTFRVRMNLFFIFVFPLVIVLILGLTFGRGSTPRVGVVWGGTGSMGQALVAELEKAPGMKVVSVSDSASLLSQVERGNLSAGVVVPSDYDRAVRSGRHEEITYLARPGRSSQQLGRSVEGVVAKQAAVLGAARFASDQGGGPSFDSALAVASQISARSPSITVSHTTIGAASLPQSFTEFDSGAWTELLLFLFLLGLMGASTALIESRRLGLSRRMLATPTSARTVIAGEVLGRILVGIVQAVVIIIGSTLFFGVRWGDPIAVAAVVLVFMFVSAGAGVLLGAALRNEQQAMGVSLLLGMGMAAIGGCMVPLHVFPAMVQRIAHITPHAWANDAFLQIVGNGAGITSVLPQLGVLVAFATVLLSLAAWRLQHVLTTG